MPTNDDGLRSPLLPDPHGHAALLLVESLIHELCENATISAEAAVAIAERAVNVQSDHAEAADDARASHWQSHALLSAIAASLKTALTGSQHYSNA
jgi:hypothetical protein